MRRNVIRHGACRRLYFPALVTLLVAGLPGFVSAQPRIINAFGMDWTVRSARRPTAPGGNTFADGPRHVRVDESGAVHLTLGEHATEIRRRVPTGYGIYEARLEGRLDRLDPQAVFGFFTFELPSDHPHNREIDIEFSRWGDPAAPNTAYTVHPDTEPANQHRFDFVQEGDATTHRFAWAPGRVEFTSWHGHGEYPPPPELEIARFTLESAAVPTPGRARIYFNYWRFRGAPLQTGTTPKIIIRDFRFEARATGR